MASSGLTGLGTRKKTRSLPIIPIFAWLLILLAIGLFALQLVNFSQQSDQLAGDVTVGGVDVGGLSAAEAVARWEEAYAQPIVLWYNDSPILLDPAAVGFRTKQESMLAAARSASQNETSFWSRFVAYLTGRITAETTNVNLSADYQERLLENFLLDVAARYDKSPGDAQFDLQTLSIRPGAVGYALDVEQAIPLVDAALKDPTNRQVVLPLKGTNGGRPEIGALRDLIVAYLDSEGFVYDGQNSVASVYIMDLETGAEVNLLSDVAVSAASTVKISILMDYFRNLLFAPSDDEAFLMAQSLLCSNNSSSNLIMQLIGNNDLFTGIADVTTNMQYVGARNSYISAPLYLGGDQVLGSIAAPPTSPNASFNTGADPYNQTTTEDLGTMLGMIYDCAMYGSGLMTAYRDGEYTQQECRQMLNLMSANDLGRLLQAGIPAGVPIAHKNGWLENVHGDAGIVFAPNGRNYIIAAFVWENGDFFSYERAWPLIEGISRAAWNYFVPEQPLIAARTDIPEQAVACDAFAPPYGEVELDDINGWRDGGEDIVWPSQ
ncbi:MAG: serine hydrolase [Anaerolineae bacterium]